jgi:hypothetical protein
MLREFASEHALLLGWAFGLSTALLLVSVVLAPIIVARMRVDYFTSTQLPADSFRERHPVARSVIKMLKNAFGMLLLLAGVAMLVLPGQGVLTMLAGLALVDFPGKRRVQRTLVAQRHVRGTLQWLRRRAGQPPLELD